MKKDRIKLNEEMKRKEEIVLNDNEMFQFEKNHHLMTIGEELSVMLQSVQNQLHITQLLLKKQYQLYNTQNLNYLNNVNNLHSLYNKNQIDNQNEIQTRQLELEFIYKQNEFHLNVFSQFMIPL